MKYHNYLIVLLLLLFTACKDVGLFSSDKTIAIQPLGQIEHENISEIKQSLIEMYGYKVVVLPQRKIYPEAFVNLKSPRYRADSLLKFLKRDMPDSIDYILGITTQDISTTKYDVFPIIIKKPENTYKDWGVFGLGQCPGKSCVISFFRIGKVSNSLKTERLQKIAVHEIGHNLGLPHCDNKSCVMTDAVESIKTIDKAKLELCSACRLKL